MKQFIAFVRKRILSHLPRPAHDADSAGYAHCADNPFRLCHHYGSKECACGRSRPFNDAVTRRIIDRVDASEYFTVIRRLHSPEEAERFFKEQ